MLHEFPPWFLISFAVAFGLIWGSFINVVIHRVPRGESIIRPASRCPACHAPIRPWNNVPVVSWLLLRGRARCCGARIPARYVLVELLGGLLSVALLEAVVLELPPETTLLQAIAVYVVSLALGLGLIASAFIDIEHMYIPDAVSLPAIAIGIATFRLRPPLTLTESLLSAGAGFAFVWLVFGVLYRLVRGRTGMGLGDAKLLAVAGAWFGWKGALFVLLAGAVQGTIATLFVLLVKGRIQEPEAVAAERAKLLAEVDAIVDERERVDAEKELLKDPIFETSEPTDSAIGNMANARVAFGPFLVLATLEYLLIGDALIAYYRSWVEF